ncbi:hypothetical protein [Klebsiella pneumoniae]|uniref:hypothetical protein n=1 Tax=Klebsiella pneumoniae TaxID=573 RepID=UPI001D0D79EF|nr:hypothetical protein [Klebsiella pneumoniae]
MKKGIRDVFSACDIRRVTSHDNAKWSRGPTTYMAIPLAHLDGRKDGRIVGWQRIDQRGGKFQTSAITSGDFVGACFVIGNLNGAQNIAVVEGFATGASVWLATRKDPKKSFDAVVVAVAANNMIHVVEQLVNMYPAAKITCALDNDRKSSAEGKGKQPAYVPASTFSQNLAASNAFIPPLKTIPSWSAATSTTCTDYVDSARPVASYSPKGTA